MTSISSVFLLLLLPTLATTALLGLIGQEILVGAADVLLKEVTGDKSIEQVVQAVRAAISGQHGQHPSPTPSESDTPSTKTVRWNLTEAFLPGDDLIIEAVIGGYFSLSIHSETDTLLKAAFHKNGQVRDVMTNLI